MRDKQCNNTVQHKDTTIQQYSKRLKRPLEASAAAHQWPYLGNTLHTHSTICCTRANTLCIQSAIYSRICCICENRATILAQKHCLSMVYRICIYNSISYLYIQFYTKSTLYNTIRHQPYLGKC